MSDHPVINWDEWIFWKVPQPQWTTSTSSFRGEIQEAGTLMLCNDWLSVLKQLYIKHADP